MAQTLDHKFTLFGCRARLVLEDDQGEFNVANPWLYDGSKWYIDTNRVSEAVARRKEAAHDRRPTY